MTIKGQITVPKDLRDAFGWKVGEELAFVREADGVKIVTAQGRKRGRAVLERLKEAPWKAGLTTEGLMALTRGRSR